MRLVTYRRGRTAPRVGALVDDTVLDLVALAADRKSEPGALRRPRGGFPKTMLALIQGGPDVWNEARQALDHGRGDPEPRRRRPRGRASAGLAAGPRSPGGAHPTAGAQHLLPRAQRQGARGRARRRGAAASRVLHQGAGVGAAARGKIVHHSVTKELDYEVELTVVIGTAGHDVRREQALAHVFGYTVINDVTARDLQKRHGQWFKGKTLDTFCPMGPVLVTADEIPDPQTLAITLRVNGETRQSSHTSKMIFPVDECISVQIG